MRKSYIATALAFIVSGISVLYCSAGQIEGGPQHVFTSSSPEVQALHAKENLLDSIKNLGLSNDAQKINVTTANNSTILNGFVKDDRERQLISHLAEQANCPGIINKLKVRAPVQSTSSSKQASKAKTIVIKNGRQISY